MSFTDTVLDIIRAIPAGRVMSYGQIAAMAGHPRAARRVAQIVKRGEGLPWHRVLRSDGSCAPDLAPLQQALLEDEGVVFLAGRVMDRYFLLNG